MAPSQGSSGKTRSRTKPQGETGKGSGDRSSATTGRTVKYDYREPADWARKVGEFGQIRLDDGATIVLSGDCPRCLHHMEVELPIARQTGGLSIGATLDAESLDTGERFGMTASCNCKESHKDRPEDADGCGAFGHLDIG